MTTEPRLHPRHYFESLYRDAVDPWGFADEWYERRKYALTLATLPRERYRRAVEPGCANGDLTSLLAERCDKLISFDFVSEVVERAQVKSVGRANVRVLRAVFPAWWPRGTGDLVVWSEVAYYLYPAAWAEAIRGLEGWLEPGGTLVSVHYLGDTDYPMRGEEVAARLDGLPFLSRSVSHREALFELGVWRRV